jgi:septum formation protein
MKNIVLASASPRRRELLEMIGLEIIVNPSECQEDLSIDIPPHELAQFFAEKKAKNRIPHHPDAIIIAADTLGELNGEVFGKPHTAEEAKNMITKLSGKTHNIITGYSIIDTKENKTHTASVTSQVTFRNLTETEIDNYIATGESLDKAAAYAIQGIGALIVEKFEGDFFNVVGFPIKAIVEDLKQFGINIL